MSFLCLLSLCLSLFLSFFFSSSVPLCIFLCLILFLSFVYYVSPKNYHIYKNWSAPSEREREIKSPRQNRETEISERDKETIGLPSTDWILQGVPVGLVLTIMIMVARREAPLLVCLPFTHSPTQLLSYYFLAWSLIHSLTQLLNFIFKLNNE